MSVARTTYVKLPPTRGVPEITPAELSVRPAGNAPLLMLNAYGAVPPLAEFVMLG